MANNLINGDSFEFVEGATLEAFDAVSADVDDLKQRMTTAESDIDTAETEIGSLKTRMTKAESDIDAAVTDIISLDARVSIDRSDISSLKTRMTTAESDINAAEDNITSLKNLVPVLLWFGNGTAGTTATLSESFKNYRYLMFEVTSRNAIRSSKTFQVTNYGEYSPNDNFWFESGNITKVLEFDSSTFSSGTTTSVNKHSLFFKLTITGGRSFLIGDNVMWTWYANSRTEEVNVCQITQIYGVGEK